MPIKNFDAMFNPRSIALIGGSNRPGSVGAVLAHNLMDAGFAGPVMTVNPHEAAIHASLNYHTVADLPQVPDLAVVATPPEQAVEAIAALAVRGCRAAVVITAGFGEGGVARGAALRQALLDAARPVGMRIIGPNCLGLMRPGIGLNASFAHLPPPAGELAFVGQSGAMATTILDWVAGRGAGFSHIVSLGDMVDVDFGDMLDYLAEDDATRAILLYVEAITSARKFMSAARRAAAAKPVIVLKAGRSREGARAAASHTGALAGADLVYDAAFRQAGLLRVDDLRDLLDAAETLTRHPKVSGDRLAIITNGGGAGVLAADALAAHGGHLAELTPAVRRRLDQVLPSSWSHANPIDILGDADAGRYAKAVQAVVEEGAQDALLVMNCPVGVTDNLALADTLAPVLARTEGVPVLTTWLGSATAETARATLERAGLATYETPEEAVRAFAHLAEHARNQRLLLEPPETDSAIDGAARQTALAIIERASGEGRTILTEPEAKAVLQAYGVPVAEARTAGTPAAAAELSALIGFPVALKILSPDISHKSDVGGVALALADAEQVRRSAEHMLEAVAAKKPEARIEGFVVEPMARAGGLELLAGFACDPVFGPMVMFGQGGVSAEAVADVAMAMPPFSKAIASDLIARTRVAKLMAGYRNIPAVKAGSVEEVLRRLGVMTVDLPEIQSLDVNPLAADAEGVIAVDARIVLAGSARAAMADQPRPSSAITCPASAKAVLAAGTPA